MEYSRVCVCALFLLLSVSIASCRRAGETVIIDGVSYTVLETYQPGRYEEIPPSLAGILYTEPYIGTESDFTYTLVSKYIENNNWELYPVWVNATGYAGPVEAQNYSLGFSQFVLYQALGAAPRPCGEALIKFLTAGLFPVSNVIDFNFTASGDFPLPTLFFPSFPSQAVCQDVYLTCPPAIPVSTINSIVGDCSRNYSSSSLGGMLKIPEQAQFPKVASHYLLNFAQNRYIVYLPATNYPVNPVYTPPCQYPLTLNKKAFASDKTARPCQDKCQSLLAYSQEDWEVLFVIEAVCGWLSWITAIYMTITLSMIPKNRRYPGFMTIFVYLGFTFFNTVFVVISWYGERGYWVCPDEYTYPDKSFSHCAFTASFIIFGGLVVCFFWTLMSVNTYLSISLRMSLDPKVWGPISLAIGLGIPIIAVIVEANIEFLYEPILLFCFNFTTWYVWLFWQVPLLIGMLVNLYCCAFVLYEIRNISDSSKGKRGKIFKIIRILGFLLCFFEVAAFIFSFNAYSVDTKAKDYSEALTAYGQCLITNQQNCQRPPPGVGAPSMATMVVFVIQFSVIGAVTFLILGTTNQVLWFWCRRIKGESEESSTGGSSSISKASWAAAGGGGDGEGGEDSYDPDQ